MHKNQYYYASSNSMLGFQSYFDKIYDPKKMERIYIIKGGPGTGKSSTIRKVAEHFDGKYKCEYFLCSSDSKSLDGLIIDQRIALIDGTSPHATEAKFPGAVEIIVDNASGVKKDIAKRRSDIIELNYEKTRNYKAAYAFLRAAGELKTENSKKVADAIDYLKLEAAIDRYFKQNIAKEKNYLKSIRLVEGITPNGINSTHGFEVASEKTAIILNGKGYEGCVYDRFAKTAKEYGMNTCISYDPLIPYSINAVMLPSASICLVNYDKFYHGDVDYDKYKVINFERFIKKNSRKDLKKELKFSSKCIQALVDEAIEYISKASKIHLQLEKIYSQYTDFEQVDKNISTIIQDAETMFLS